jgi:hypothetical protein
VIKFVYNLLVIEDWGNSSILHAALWDLFIKTMREVTADILVMFLLWNLKEINRKTLQLVWRIEKAKKNA